MQPPALLGPLEQFDKGLSFPLPTVDDRKLTIPDRCYDDWSILHRGQRIHYTVDDEEPLIVLQRGILMSGES